MTSVASRSAFIDQLTIMAQLYSGVDTDQTLTACILGRWSATIGDPHLMG